MSEGAIMTRTTLTLPETASVGSVRTILLPGTHVDSIEIESVIGYGRHGPLYLARDPEFGRVVVKEFAPHKDGPNDDAREPAQQAIGEATPEAAGGNARSVFLEGSEESSVPAEYDAQFAAGLTLFRLMGQALCTVRHPNLVAVRRCLEANGTAYLVMDHIDGPSLDYVLSAEEDSSAKIALEDLVLAMLGALDRLHNAGFLHRDVTPANIRFASDDMPVLVDLGAALPADLAAEPPYQSWFASGYAAPEQYRADARQGPWTDVYGLAAVAYRVVSGTLPTDARARISGTPLLPALVAGRGRYTEDVLSTVDRALSLEASERPQSAREWIAAFHLSEPDQAEYAPIPMPEPTPEQLPGIAASEVDPMERPPAAKPHGAEGTRAVLFSRGSWRWITAAVLVLVALPAAIFGGRHYHRSYIKSEWLVDASGTGDARTIGEALAAARDGATIRVLPGHYPEALMLTRPLTVQGAGDGEEIVVVAPGAGPCITITAEAGAFVRGLNLIGGSGGASSPAGACLNIAGGSTVTVSDTIINNPGGVGVRIGDNAAAEIRSNRIETTLGAAVIVEGDATGTVTANTIRASGAAGILVRGTAAPQISGNRIDSAGHAGILASGASSAQIADNRISNNARSGIEIRGTADPIVRRNHVEGSGQAGLYIHESARGTFEGNTVIGNAFSGIVVGAGARPLITDNRIAENKEHGILVLAGGGGQFERNTVTDNTGYGIALDIAADVKVDDLERAGNTFDGNREPQIIVGETPRPGRARQSHLDLTPAAP